MAQQKQPVGTFELSGHEFACYGPESDADALIWTIVVTKDGVEVIRDETVRILYRPIFGYDVADMMARDERVEQIIKELGLE